MSSFNVDKSSQILFDLSTVDSNSAKNPKFDDESSNNDDKKSGANVDKTGLDSNSKDNTNPDLSNPNQNPFSSSPALINIQSDMISTTTAALPSSTTVVSPKFEDNDDSVGNILRVTTTISKSVDVFDKDGSDKDGLRPSPVAITTTTTPKTTETTITTTETTTTSKTTTATAATTITTTAITKTTTTTTILENNSSSIDNPVQSGLSIPGQPINSLDYKISSSTATTATTTTRKATASDDAFYDQDSSTSDPTITTTKKKKRRPTTTTTTTLSTASDDYDIDSTSESTTTTTRKKQRRRTTTTTTTTNPITSSDGAYYDIDPDESSTRATSRSTTPFPTKPPKFVPEFGSTNSGNDVDDSNEKRGVVELKPSPQGELGSVSNFGNRNPNLDNRYPGDKNHRFVNNMNFDVSGMKIF